jgi:DNA-directed RNA polymerase II subunit RPB1
MNLLMWVDSCTKIPIPAILRPVELWTGKQVFSLVLPKVDFTTSFSGHIEATQDDTNVLIHRGELLMGNLNKKILGPTAGICSRRHKR